MQKLVDPAAPYMRVHAWAGMLTPQEALANVASGKKSAWDEFCDDLYDGFCVRDDTNASGVQRAVCGAQATVMDSVQHAGHAMHIKRQRDRHCARAHLCQGHY